MICDMEWLWSWRRWIVGVFSVLLMVGGLWFFFLQYGDNAMVFA